MERPEAEQRAIVAYCNEQKIDLSTAITIDHRQVRFGGEPGSGFDQPGEWRMVEVCRDEECAIQSVDTYGGYYFTEATITWKATAVDPRLVAQRQREEQAHAEKVAAAVERQKQEREDDARRAIDAASEAAFVRLRDGKDGADDEPGTTRVRTRLAKLQADAEFAALYSAVMLSTAVPAKRKAIKAALARAQVVLRREYGAPWSLISGRILRNQIASVQRVVGYRLEYIPGRPSYLCVREPLVTA
jgi:hypothetical protein